MIYPVKLLLQLNEWFRSLFLLSLPFTFTTTFAVHGHHRRADEPKRIRATLVPFAKDSINAILIALGKNAFRIPRSLAGPSENLARRSRNQ
ncbi:MAG: hypothetical protein IT426_14030 [Pirellulales bacterium]|nr:hypothetical protein [Pirellulales bacterium]